MKNVPKFEHHYTCVTCKKPATKLTTKVGASRLKYCRSCAELSVLRGGISYHRRVIQNLEAKLAKATQQPTTGDFR